MKTPTGYKIKTQNQEIKKIFDALPETYFNAHQIAWNSHTLKANVKNSKFDLVIFKVLSLAIEVKLYRRGKLQKETFLLEDELTEAKIKQIVLDKKPSILDSIL